MSKRLLQVALVVLGVFQSGIELRAAGWVQGGGFRSMPLAVPADGKTGFTIVKSDQTGVTFVNKLSDRLAARNQIRLVGSGVALADVDGDGWCDVYLCRLEGGNALYRNLGGWKFEEITSKAGVVCEDQFSTGCVFADLDGDGDSDLLVNALSKGTRCFFNDGNGGFTEQVDAGLLKERSPTSMSLADIDADGDLDLYVANYRSTTIRSTGLDVLEVDGKRVLRPEDRGQYEFTPDGMILEHGEVDVLYLNDGKGRFARVPWQGGRFLDEEGKALAEDPKDWSLSVMMRDVNRDGAPDIYVCSDFWSPDRFWVNDGKGTFRAVPFEAMRNSSTFSMGVDFADIDRDGDDDFFVLDMKSLSHVRRMTQLIMPGHNVGLKMGKAERFQVERNTLLLNRGDGTYAEIAQLSGLQASEWSWGVVFLDVDLDGYEDLLITTGHGFDTQDSDTEERISRMGRLETSKLHTKLLMYPRLKVPNVAFRNQGDLTFAETGGSWGFDKVGISHGIAMADLDRDGDQDVVVNNLNDEVSLYRNETVRPRIAVRLRGKRANSAGVGARIRVVGAGMTQVQEMVSGGRYLSGDDQERVFAVGDDGARMSLEVDWPGGGRSVVQSVQANYRYEVAEPAVLVAVKPSRGGVEASLFEPSAGFPHRHHEEPFDDYARQSWLSKQLSHLGPAVAWCDLDDDGWEDLVVGSGRGGLLAMYRNRGNGMFDAISAGSMMGAVYDDQGGIVGWPSGGGKFNLLLAQSNYETAQTNVPSVIRLELRPGGMQMVENLPGHPSSAGPMAVADVDGDGDLDLFVGGRVIAGRYPEPATSRLYLRDEGKYRLAKEWGGLGLVSGAVFSDLNGDGFSELIVACEWGALRVFQNRRGKFHETTAALGLTGYRGWWNGVTAGDFDGDGRMDIVASNWGRNHAYQSYLKDGIRLAYGDLAENGLIEGVEAYTEPVTKQVMPWRDLEVLQRSMPWLRPQFGSHKKYARATLKDVLGGRAVNELSVNWLDSTLFLNRGGKFEARSLPLEAQFSPAFGIAVGDFDGDGAEDLFLAQNFSRVEPENGRAEGGRGLLLAGDGKGGFRSVPASESGLKLDGDQRACAVSDTNGDGRLDLVVTQNGAGTRLYRNVRGKAGLRVRLSAGVGNPIGVGAVVRLVEGGRSGPAREIHVGAGYWSQDGAVQVLATNGSAERTLSVRWVGGKTVSFEVPAGCRDLVVDSGRGLRVVR